MKILMLEAACDDQSKLLLDWAASRDPQPSSEDRRLHPSSPSRQRALEGCRRL